MTVRAKFRCHFIQKADDNSHCTVHMSPVTDDTPENKTWSKYTPGGLLQMHISNPDAYDHFEQGNEYYIDIHPVCTDAKNKEIQASDNHLLVSGDITLTQ